MKCLKGLKWECGETKRFNKAVVSMRFRASIRQVRTDRIDRHGGLVILELIDYVPTTSKLCDSGGQI
jgi:hypothetical protein